MPYIAATAWATSQAPLDVICIASNQSYRFDTSVVRSMHFMMLAHDHEKSPGRYRTGPIFVRDERTGANLYEGPDADLVPALMEALTDSLRSHVDLDPLVRAAMAHLNLVMIHPFRDGNGRMARALQTLVLSRRAMYEAVLGYRIRRASYIKATGIEERTASRDLARLVEHDLLKARGETRGRHYIAGKVLTDLHHSSREHRRPLSDPYPRMRTELVKGSASRAV